MGISTIRKAKRIVLLAWGISKAEIVQETIEGGVSSQVPATYLQEHENTTFVLDREASDALTRIKTPWLVRACVWTDELKKKAIFWLSEQLKKPILKLTDKEYNEYGMGSLLVEEGSAYELNIKMFNALQHTITGWPGGKPNADDSTRPERSTPERKRVIIFSPHPDDDVISMGGTFNRLVEQGHEVHIAYQTSGNIAVSDQDALRFAEVALSLNPEAQNIKEVIQTLVSKGTNELDTLAVRKLKGDIRKAESLGATRYFEVPDAKVHFLNLPFMKPERLRKTI